MTFLEIFQNIARRTDKNPDNPDPQTQARINQFINDRYRELMRLPGILPLRDESFSLTTVANQARYVLPVAAGQIASVFDSTNRIALAQRTMPWIRQRDPSVPARVIGTPWVYAILNYAGPLQQPAIVTANALVASSTSALDTGVLEVEYQDEFGGFRVVQTTLSGTILTSVLATCVQVFRITYLQSAVGQITLKQSADGLVIANLAPTSLVAQTGNAHAGRAWVLVLWPTPAGAYSYIIDASRPRMTLVDPLDEPAIPEDFHTLLVWGGCSDELLKMDDDRREDYEKRWAADVKALRAYLHQARGQRLIPTGPGAGVGWSPMGPNFPGWW